MGAYCSALSLLEVCCTITVTLLNLLKNFFKKLLVVLRDESTSQWSQLPNDLLLAIIPHLDDWKTDLFRLRAVCQSWRTALPLSELPTLESQLEVPSLDDGGDPLFLLQTPYYLLSRPHSTESSTTSSVGDAWVAKMGEIVGVGLKKWKLLNPVYDPPHRSYLTAKPRITGEINLLVCRIRLLAKPMCLQRRLTYRSNVKSRKIVGGWYLINSTYCFAALVLLRNALTDLLFWRLGNQEWINIYDRVSNKEEVQLILDIAFHNAKFYVLELICGPKWRVGVVDPENFTWVSYMHFISTPDIVMLDGLTNEPPQLIVEGRFLLYNQFRDVKLLSSNCELYLVLRAFGNDYDLGTAVMFVFLMKEQEGGQSKWERVSNLGDQIFFVGEDVSFALPLSTENLPQWKANTICWFPKNFSNYSAGHVKSISFPMPNGAECLQSILYPPYNKYFFLFNMGEEEKGLLCVYGMPDEDQNLYMELFFPPPAWVKWHCPRLQDAEVRLSGLQMQLIDLSND